MKLQIDALTSSTGWTMSETGTISEITEPKYIAGLNDQSLLLTFQSADTVKTAVKTFSTPFNVTDYDTLIFSIWSQKLGFNKDYLQASDFAYKIDIDGVLEFYIPVYSMFNDIEIGIEDVTSITKIKITALHSITDSIIISEMVAEKEEIPLDILTATKESIDYWIDKLNGLGLLLGTVTASSGVSSISLSNPIFLDRYGVIEIVGGGHTEIHQIEDNNAGTFQFNDNFDGNTLLNDFTAASVYLQYPSYINPGQFEVRLPGISIWGIEEEPILRGAKLEVKRDSFKIGGGSKERTEGQILKFPIQVDCEARSQELIDTMTRAVRYFIAQEVLWINGRKHDIYFSGTPVEFKPTVGIDYIPKKTYTFNVEVKENINDRVDVVNTTIINTEIDII